MFTLRYSDNYVAVCVEHFIMVIKEEPPIFPSYDQFGFVDYTIWVYNLYTEEWRKHGELLPCSKACEPATLCLNSTWTVALGADVYLFGGEENGKFFASRNFTNSMLKLDKQPDGHFVWSDVTDRNGKLPSPRCQHTGWTFGEKIWIFGGHGTSGAGYLDDFGSFENGRRYICNNQLLCFDPVSQKWANPKCFGDVPSPRFSHATAVTWDKVVLFGGHDASRNCLGDLYELNMRSLTWTQIQNGHIKPSECYLPVLTTSSEGGHLVLHDFYCKRRHQGFNDTTLWILNLESQSWIKYTKSVNRLNHSRFPMGFTGTHSVVMIAGASRGHEADHTIHIMSQHKSLQQLSIQTINNHWEMVPHNRLPQKLRALFSGP